MKPSLTQLASRPSVCRTSLLTVFVCQNVSGHMVLLYGPVGACSRRLLRTAGEVAILVSVTLFLPSKLYFLSLFHRTTFMPGRGVFWALTVTCFSATSTLAVYLSARLDQTQAKCSTDFDWASNSLGLSPCLLSAFVWGSCFTGSE